jgi:hypothetical protein
VNLRKRSSPTENPEPPVVIVPFVNVDAPLLHYWKTKCHCASCVVNSNVVVELIACNVVGKVNPIASGVGYCKGTIKNIRSDVGSH